MVHIAGFPVQIGSKYRQRCAWCDVVLIDGDLSCEATAPSDHPHAACPRHYDLGALVEVTQNGACTMFAVVPHEDGAKLPLNSCSVVVPKMRMVQ